MPKDKVFHQYPIGSYLFQDSESFMADLTDDELASQVKGGSLSDWRDIWRVIANPTKVLAK